MTEPSQTPGAMSVQLSRTLPSGHVIEFEAAPAGWIKADGDPRLRDWRAYYLTDGLSTDGRERVESVTTICDRILPKDGLAVWSERQGIRGTVEAVRQSLIPVRLHITDGLEHVTVELTDEEAVAVVRRNHLGADSARDEAADRGLNIHALLEQYMNFGVIPNPVDHPIRHRPFIQGLVKWIVATDPKPVAVELLVADPEEGYAGRLDLLAKMGRKLTLVDAKTQERGAIYESAHVQVRLYRRAEDRYGEHKIRAAQIVVFDGAGGYREMEVIADDDLAERALAYYRPIKRVMLACDQVNRIVREQLAEAA